MPGRTSRRSAWWPFVAWIAVVFALSSIPDLGPPDVGLPMTDKLAHLGEYGILGMLFTRGRAATESRRRSMLLAAIAGAVVGSLDETYQSGTPGREVSALDVVADTVGAACGALVWRLWAAWRARARTQEVRS